MPPGFDRVLHYFPDLSSKQQALLERLFPLYQEWNEKINVISRKDFANLYLHHVIHSLSLSRVFMFEAGDRILDVGTGGGFPGIPMAILCPDATFHLVDSIGKKIAVVKAVAESLGLPNVTFEQHRAEHTEGKYDFAISRAVAPLPKLDGWVRKKLRSSRQTGKPSGLLCLKGGDLREEMAGFKKHIRLYPLADWFEEEWFAEKKIVYVAY